MFSISICEPVFLPSALCGFACRWIFMAFMLHLHGDFCQKEKKDINTRLQLKHRLKQKFTLSLCFFNCPTKGQVSFTCAAVLLFFFNEVCNSVSTLKKNITRNYILSQNQFIYIYIFPNTARWHICCFGEFIFSRSVCSAARSSLSIQC